MSLHEQYAEDLALYALDSLKGDERASLENHLEECASCRRDLEQLRGDAALLALTASGPRPPARAKSRLMGAIAKEPRTQPSKRPVSWWAGLGWLAAAVMIVAVATVWRQNTRLKSSVVQSAGMLEKQRLELEQARRISDLLKAPDATSYEVLPVSLRTPPPPAGKAIYSRQQNGLVFVASNLRALPSKKTYELWLVPTQGAPIPAGVFKPDARGSAVVINPPLPAGVEAKAFAITIEPEGGSKTPTPPIIMMGAGV
jgi:anti-sigma-K factor RskA